MRIPTDKYSSYSDDYCVLVFHPSVTSSFHFIAKIDAHIIGHQNWKSRYRKSLAVRRGEHRGGRRGNIDDSLLHGCLICFVVRICRIELSNLDLCHAMPEGVISSVELKFMP